MKSALIGTVLLGLAAATAGAVGCTTSAPSSPESTAQNVSAKLTLYGWQNEQDEQNFGQNVAWKITNPNGFTKSGTFNSIHTNDIDGVITGIPVGPGYTITVTSNSQDHLWSCTGTGNKSFKETCTDNDVDDQLRIRLTCQNHMVRSWHRVPVIVDVNVVCAVVDAGADAPDTSCTPTASCQSAGATCGKISDGCGTILNCGTCASGSACQLFDGSTGGTCVCTPKTTCTVGSGGAACGTQSDGCGGTITCGPTCPTNFTCNNQNNCVCSPTTACTGGQACGTQPDGCGGTVNCGTCTAPNTCNSSGQCICTPQTSCPAGDVCGTVSDGCSGTVNCGTCPSGSTCSANNKCACTPLTACSGGQTCGTQPDGCGGTVTCGTCAANQSCDATGQCVTCPTTCPAGDNCGTVTNTCGQTVNCGSCASPQTCGGGTPSNPNMCGCTPSTTCPSGVTCGTAPDGCGGTLQCGSCPSGNTCTGGKCVCVPATSCPMGQVCGTAPDGCGGTITCTPGCPSGQTCSAAGTCSCVPRTVCLGSDTCGTQSDGCGGTISCGPACTAPQTCVISSSGGTSGTCQCTPKTTCTAGATCGSEPDGCGGTISCGPTCPSGTACQDTVTSTSGTCVSSCVPATTCSGGANCGTQSNGCGGTINCGSCTAPATCTLGSDGTSGTCQTSPCAANNGGAGCTPTEQKFVNKDPTLACYQCLVNGDCLDNVILGDTGIECGDLTGSATAGEGSGSTFNQLCLNLLDCELSTNCASTDISICYCGSLGAGTACTTATTAGSGPCFAQEANAANHPSTDPASSVTKDLNNKTEGSGKLNQIFICGKQNSCDTLCAP